MLSVTLIVDELATATRTRYVNSVLEYVIE